MMLRILSTTVAWLVFGETWAIHASTLDRVDPVPLNLPADIAFEDSLGDGGGAATVFDKAQRNDKDFLSGILRLDIDGRPGSVAPNPHPSVHGGTYWIPPGNPCLNPTNLPSVKLTGVLAPEKIRTELYPVGLRNPYRIYFDSLTGELYASDAGQFLQEEINQIVSGGNYGWNPYPSSRARQYSGNINR